MKKVFLFVYILFFSGVLISQNTNVISGPMVSFIDGYSTQIWFLLDKDAKNIKIDFKDYDEDKLLEYNFTVTNEHQFTQYVPYTVTIEKLLPNTEYIASVYVDDIFIKELDIFTKRPHLDDIQFLLGYNLTNSTSSSLFTHMRRTNSDFMVWLGGYVSYADDRVNFNNIFNSYVNSRIKPEINDFISSLPQIASWSSLDYGSDLGFNWALKDSAYLAFDMFWPNSLNKTYNYTFYDYGVYQRYNYNDLDLFLLDSRSFREVASSNSTLYGDKQIERLFQEINNNGSTFTIIASPSPFTFDTHESFLNYKKQFEYFIYRLRVSGTEGVVLVSTGSKEETQMYQYDLSETKWNGKVKSFYPIYEFNFPPLSDNKFSLIRVEGTSGKRILSFDTYNEKGNLIYRKRIHETELKN